MYQCYFNHCLNLYSIASTEMFYSVLKCLLMFKWYSIWYICAPYKIVLHILMCGNSLSFSMSKMKLSSCLLKKTWLCLYSWHLAMYFVVLWRLLFILYPNSNWSERKPVTWLQKTDCQPNIILGMKFALTFVFHLYFHTIFYPVLCFLTAFPVSSTFKCISSQMCSSMQSLHKVFNFIILCMEETIYTYEILG